MTSWWGTPHLTFLVALGAPPLSLTSCDRSCLQSRRTDSTAAPTPSGDAPLPSVVHSAPPVPQGTSRLAFLTPHRIDVLSADLRTTGISHLSHHRAAQDIRWSPDGRFLGWLECEVEPGRGGGCEADSSRNWQIVTYDTLTPGHGTTSVNLPSPPIPPLVATRVAFYLAKAVGRGEPPVLYELNAGAAKASGESVLEELRPRPEGRSLGRVPHVLLGTADGVIAGEDTPGEGMGPTRFFRVNADGERRLLGDDDDPAHETLVNIAARLMTASRAFQRVAYVTGTASGSWNEWIRIRDASDWRIVGHAFLADSLAIQGRWKYCSLEFGEDGRLLATGMDLGAATPRPWLLVGSVGHEGGDAVDAPRYNLTPIAEGVRWGASNATGTVATIAGSRCTGGGLLDVQSPNGKSSFVAGEAMEAAWAP